MQTDLSGRATGREWHAFFVRGNQLGRSPFPALTAQEGFAISMFRESRDIGGALSFLAGDDRLAEIRGMRVVNVTTGQTVLF